MKKFYEETLENLIYKNAQSKEGREILHSCGLDIQGKLLRQVTIGNSGRADLVSVYINGREYGKHVVYVTVYELKKDIIERRVVFQIAKYLHGLICYFSKSKYAKDFTLKLRAVIIGSDYDDEKSYEALTWICPKLELYKYSYELTGLKFEKVKPTNKGSKFDSLDELINKFDKFDKKEIVGHITPTFPF